MSVTLLFAYLAVFVGTVLAAQVAAQGLFRRTDRSQRVTRRLAVLTSAGGFEEKQSLLRQQHREADRQDPLATRLAARVATLLQQADLAWSTPRALVVLGGVAALLWFGSSMLMMARNVLSPLTLGMSLGAAIVLPCVGAWLYVSRRREARLKKLEEHLPLALDIVIRAIRAGHPVIAAVRLAADELDDPIASELRKVVDETAYGSDFRQALHGFAQRTGSQNASFFAVSVSIQAETGGSLADVLEGLVAVMRARSTLAKKVSSLASEGRASAAVLSALPVLMVGSLILSNPTFYTSKFDDPVFWPIVGVVTLMYLVGQAIIHRITHFKY